MNQTSMTPFHNIILSMDNNQLTEFVKISDPEAEVKEGKQFIEVELHPNKLHSLARILRFDEKAQFDYLVCISGVDYGQDLGVVYHLLSTKYGHKIVLKTRTPDRVEPVIDSVSDIWKTADFQEREVYDLLGIKFRNHPDLRRLFLTKSWGFPLRKDYTDEINIVTK